MVRISLGEGEPLLDALLRQGQELAHDCGGLLACASCAVIVHEGTERLSPALDDELDILERASLTQSGARLACQAAGEAGEVVVEIPGVNTPEVALAQDARPVTLTARAASHFAGQLASRPAAFGVRLAVQPTGCSGLGYRLDLADAARAGDSVFESGAIRILVDAATLPYVQGASIDIAREGLECRLRVDNPNVAQTCGCGGSFAV